MSIEFDGIDDTINCVGFLTTLSNAVSGSISGWINIPSSSPENALNLLSISKASGVRTEFFINFNNSIGVKRILITLFLDGLTQWSIGTSINSLTPLLGTNLHFCLTHNSVTPNFYINGILQSMTFITDLDRTKWLKSIITDATNKSDTSKIGSLSTIGIETNFFNGIVTDLSIWGVALNQSKIDIISKPNKNISSYVESDNLIHNYPMNDLSHAQSADGVSIKDLMGNLDIIGSDGLNNTGLTFQAEDFLNYPAPENDYLSNVPISENINLAGGYNNNLSGGFE